MFLKTNTKAADTAINGGNAVTARKSIPSVISTDLRILGNLVTDGLVDVDGTIEGNVKADIVTVRQHGRITGDVIAECVHIYGEVHGLIRAQAVHLYSSAHVEGVIIHTSLTVEDGAFIDAKFKRLQDKNHLSSIISDVEDEESEGSAGEAFSSNLRLIG